MIIQGLWSFFCTIIGAAVGALPNGGTFNPDMTPVRSVLDQLDGLNTYLPIDEMLACIGIGLAITYARIPWAMFNWIWTKVRG
jgi:hypothetical protein